MTTDVARFSPPPLRLRRACVAALAALAGLAVLAPPGQAYRLSGKKWPTRTITYHSTARQYDDAIKAAVAAWNTSGVRVRFKPTTRRRAKLKIIYRNKSGGPAGDAVLGWIRPTVTTRRSIPGMPWVVVEGAPCGARVPIPGEGVKRIRCVRERIFPRVRLDKVGATAVRRPEIRLAMELTVAHELGHVLGLHHVRKPCSVMNYARDERCPKPPHPWQQRCRLLEADDVRGAIRRYGGRARPLAPELCDMAPALEPPLGLAASYDPDRGVVDVAWTNVGAPTLRHVYVTVTRDVCAAAPGEFDWHRANPGAPGRATVEVPSYEPGRYCVAAWSEDEYERRGPPATTWVDVPDSSGS